MTDEVEEMRFQAAVYSAHHAKAFAEMLSLLRSDRPLSPADRGALADFIEGERAPVKRGRRPEPPFSHTWRLRKAVEEIRELKHKHKTLTMEAAAEVVMIGYQMSGRPTPDREQILRELRRSTK